MAGIKETTELTDFLVSAANASGNGIQLEDLGIVVKLPSAIGGIGEIPKELADLDDEESAQLHAVIEKIELPNEHKEVVAEQALRTVQEFAKLVSVIKIAKS